MTLTTYSYGRKYEPPAGRIMQGHGHLKSYATLVAALNGTHLPASICVNFNIGTFHAIVPTVAFWLAQLLEIDAAGAMPDIGVACKGAGNAALDNEFVADSSQSIPMQSPPTSFDYLMDSIGIAIAAFGKPVFIRIGWEFNNVVGYHAYTYVAMYRKIHQRFTQLGVRNAAYAWVYEPSGPNDYLQVDRKLGAKWYPGDEYVDWWGLDVFNYNGYLNPADPNNTHHYTRMEQYLARANARGYPVMIAECDPVLTFGDDGILADGDGQAYWDGWYGPFIAWVKAHPGVKLFHLVCAEPDYPDTNLQLPVNPDLLALWIAEISNPIYMQSGEAHQLKLYNSYPWGEYEEVHGLVRDKFQTDVELGLGVPVAYDNRPFTAPDDDLYVRLQVKVDDAQPIAFSTGNTHRKTGTARGTICTPLAGGSQPAMALVDQVFTAFAGVTYFGVRFGAPAIESTTERAASQDAAGRGTSACWEVVVAIPFTADWSPLVKPDPVIGATPTFEAVANAIRGRFHDLVATQEGVPVLYENGAPQAIAEPIWSRFTMIQGRSNRVSGAGTKIRYRTTGIAVAQIFVPVNTGDENALHLADQINAAFRAVSVAGAEFRTPLVRAIGRTGPHWQVNVSLPFTVDRAVS